MSEEKKEEKKKPRRLRGQAYWEIRGAMKKLREHRETLQGLKERVAEENGCYVDQIEDLDNGKIVDDKGLVRRAKPETLKPIQEWVNTARVLTHGVEAVVEKWARAAGVAVEAINPQTGEIAEEEYVAIAAPEETT